MESWLSEGGRRALVFDIASEYGHFRKFNTTTSPLTYAVPTRPAIAGFLGAILGVERERWANAFQPGQTPVAEIFAKDRAAFGVQIVQPVKKVNIGFNLLDTEKSPASYFNIRQRTQIEFELLKNPQFRLYICLKDGDLFAELIDRVQRNRTHFTPYLGLSQFTASVEFKGVAPMQAIDGTNFQETLTAVNLTNADPDNPIRFDYDRDKGFQYTSDTMPVQMLKDRIVTEYSEVIVEKTGKTIAVKSDRLYYVENYGNIMFL